MQFQKSHHTLFLHGPQDIADKTHPRLCLAGVCKAYLISCTMNPLEHVTAKCPCLAPFIQAALPSD